MKEGYKHSFPDYLAYLLCVICFPLNPLVLLNIIEPYENKILLYPGIVIWFTGMIFVIYPVIYFKLKGGVFKGNAYVHTNKIVTSGLYSVVRHVQYTGGILSIFIATPLLYPHWIFVILGIPGIILVYMGARGEDKLLCEKFGDDYRDYMAEVPGVNILTGVFRKIRRGATHKNNFSVGLRLSDKK
jgi:protein-S-isoprenylcysteine O-methyltransferase Ste14